MPEEYYERNLPHWHPVGRSIFITWRLYSSLPQSFRYHQSNQNQKPGHQFLHFDRYLDEASTGPLWLKNPFVAEMTQSALQKGANDLNHYNLHAYAIMANHVHILITPQVPLSQIMKAIKGVTARNANKLLSRTGKVFWQDESSTTGPETKRREQDPQIYREQSCKGSPGGKSGRLARVQREKCYSRTGRSACAT
jgi:putative transposase